MLRNIESENLVAPSFLLKAWDYMNFSLTKRMKNGLIYGMSGFISGTVLALAISEIITGGLTYKVRKENTCDYEEMHVAEYDCDFDSATLERYGTESCRQFLNETNHWGESITYRGPLVNCTSISQANELVEVASEYGDAKSKEWYPGAAKKAAYLSLLPGIGLGVVGLAYGFFKKPAESSASQPSVSNNVTSNDSKQTDHYLTLRG